MLLSLAFKLLKFKSLTSLEILMNKVIRTKYCNWQNSFGCASYIIEVHCQQPTKNFFIDLNSKGVFFSNSFLSSPDILATCNGVQLLSVILNPRQCVNILENINYVADEKTKTELKQIWQNIKTA